MQSELSDREGEPFTADGGFRFVDGLAQSLERLVNRWVGLLVAGFSVLFFAANGVFAAGSPFQVNELVTFHVAALENWPRIWSAFEQGIEIHPPLYYLLAHTSLDLVGSDHLGLRVPALLGAWLGHIAIFGFVNRRVGPVYGLAAMLAPILFQWTSGLALNARGYSLLFGFSAAALWCWQVSTASTGSKRKLALAGLALSLFAVTMSHYYGVLTIVWLGLAELYRAWKAKKLDIAVVSMMALGSTAVLVLIPLIPALVQFEYHSYEPWHVIPELFTTLLTLKATPLVPLLLLPAVFSALGWTRAVCERAAAASHAEPPRHEIVALLLLCASPLFMLVFTLIGRSGFAPRFVTPVITGFIAIGAIMLACRTRAPGITGLTLLVPLAGWFLLQEYGTFRTGLDRLHMEKPYEADLSWDASQYDPTGSLPIVVAFGERALHYAYYWPPEQSARLTQVTPVPLQEIGSHVQILIPMATTLNVRSYDDYSATHRHFLLFDDRGGWFLDRLRADHARITLLGRDGPFPVLEVELPELP